MAAPFLLQYPFYSGIAVVMADSGLAAMLVELFVKLSSATTLPFFAFLSGGLLNVFVPSGGGQWAVQGPIMMSAAMEVGANLPRTAMAVALGDQWTNLIQPLAIVPVLAIAQIPLRKIMGYCFIALLYTGAIFAVALLLFECDLRRRPALVLVKSHEVHDLFDRAPFGDHGVGGKGVVGVPHRDADHDHLVLRDLGVFAHDG